MWGWNPAEMRDGTNSDYFVKLARERRHAHDLHRPAAHASPPQALADEWVPIRPGTDAALMTRHGLRHGRPRGCTTPSSSAPTASASTRARCRPGARARRATSTTSSGGATASPRRPDWAEPITTVPRDVIARLAREYATSKPAVLYQGYGMQRRAYGEQVVRAGCVLAAITGNVGIPGGWASGLGLQAPDGGALWTVFPIGENPVKASIPVFLWSEAVLRGRELDRGGRRAGRRAARHRHQHASRRWPPTAWSTSTPTSTARRASSPTTKLVEFLVVQDNFLTPTARFADLVLPACTQFETWGVAGRLEVRRRGDPAAQARRAAGRVPVATTRIARGVARRLGIEEAYTEGRDERGWVEWCLDDWRRDALPRPADARRARRPPTSACGAGRSSARRWRSRTSAATPRRTRSTPRRGRSRSSRRRCTTWAGRTRSPPCPSTSRSGRARSATRRAASRCSSSATTPCTASTPPTTTTTGSEEAFPQRLFINPLDAAARGLADGDLVRVFNDRGEVLVPLPGHRADHAGGGRHPAGGVVDARRARPRPRAARSTC